MIKRKIAILLAAIVMLSLITLSACDGTNKDVPSTGTTGTESSGGTSADERIRITYAQWGNETETAACQAVADKFNAQQDKIYVEVLKIDYDNYIAKLNTMATAGELPDTAIMSEAGVLTFAKNGLLYDISEMYEENEAKPLDCITFKNNGTPVAYSALMRF